MMLPIITLNDNINEDLRGVLKFYEAFGCEINSSKWAAIIILSKQNLPLLNYTHIQPIIINETQQ